MATRTIELSGASAVPFSARTAIDRSNIEIAPQELNLTGISGALKSQTLNLVNSADSVPADDPWYCETDTPSAHPGVDVIFTATVEQPIGEQYRNQFCLPANGVQLINFNMNLPLDLGEYTISFQAIAEDPPQLWANYTDTITVQEDFENGDGDGFDPSAVTASCSLRSSVIDEGDIGIVDVTVTNSNDAAAETSVNIIANGSILSTESVNIAANDSLSFQTSLLDLSAGSYGVEATASASPASLGGGDSAFGLARTRPLGKCDTC